MNSLNALVTSVTQPDPRNHPTLYKIQESDRWFFGLIPASWTVAVTMAPTEDGSTLEVHAPLGTECRGRWSAVDAEGGSGFVVVDRAQVKAFAPLAVFTAWKLREAHVKMLDKLCEILEKPHED
ncbi:hypothetical protein FRB97_008490 [Tulasnella sp. 331]|nr:hypothetical protein FRB97_008490 [Tulasnella sp. 331]